MMRRIFVVISLSMTVIAGSVSAAAALPLEINSGSGASTFYAEGSGAKDGDSEPIRPPGRPKAPPTAEQIAEANRLKAIRDAAMVECLRVHTMNPAPCATFADPEAPADDPEVTPGMILTAFRSIPVPKLRSVSQPGDKTLVNFDTIFYADSPDVRRSVTLLGQRVDFDITPSHYAWHHGDGTTSTTTAPGGPYPDKSVTYRYQKAHVTVAHYVVVTWGARFRVNGGPWAQVPGTVTTTGPATALRIAEAKPVLAASS